MKRIKYAYLLLLSCLWILTACNSEDLSYDIEYTPIHPLGGQYTVSISRNGTVIAEGVNCFLANTTDYDTDKCWIRIGSYNSSNTVSNELKRYFINGKISCNVPELSFSGTDVMNLAGNVTSSEETFTLTDGKLELNGATAPSGTVSDKISFTYTTTVDPGVTYSVVPQNMIFALQDKLVMKEYLSARLYYNMGNYLGNNYQACVITAQNALKDYPYTNLREDLSILILRAKYELAVYSVEDKKAERYREAVDECYAFKNEFPESKYAKEADRIFKEAQKVLGEKSDEE